MNTDKKENVLTDKFLLDLLNEFGSVARQIQKYHDEREDPYRDVNKHLPFLSQHSWFTSMCLGFADYESLLFWHLNAPNGEQEKVKYVNELFTNKYKHYFNYLVDLAIEKFPHREFAIRPAAEAHTNQQYALSVPIFLSQAEGIFRETLSAETFSGPSKRWLTVSEEAEKRLAQIANFESWLDYADAAQWTQLN